MILIGQYDSPFVRRVGIALTLYGIPFEHRPWSVSGETDLIRPYNPLTRVPTLVLDNGEVLIESHSILDYLDSLAGRAFDVDIGAQLPHAALRVFVMGERGARNEPASSDDIARMVRELGRGGLGRGASLRSHHWRCSGRRTKLSW